MRFMNSEIIETPGCEDADDVLGWLKAQGGLQRIEKFDSVNIQAPAHCLAAVAEQVRNAFPTRYVSIEEACVCVRTMAPEIYQLIKDTAPDGAPRIVPKKIGQMLIECSNKPIVHTIVDETQRRVRSTMEHAAGVCGEMLLDSLVKQVCDKFHCEKLSKIFSPVLVEGEFRTYAQNALQQHLHSPYVCKIDSTGCRIFCNGFEMAEYEQMIVETFRNAVYFLFIDCTTGSRTGEKHSKFRWLEKRAVQRKYRDRAELLVVRYSKDKTYLDDKLVSLPFLSDVHALREACRNKESSASSQHSF